MRRVLESLRNPSQITPETPILETKQPKELRLNLEPELYAKLEQHAIQNGTSLEISILEILRATML